MSCNDHSCISTNSPIEPHGLIIMDKPPGPTGFDCIRHLRRTCNFPRKWKIGHLGTLDPFASGVMVIALGKAVRYSSYGLNSPKIYRARLWLGDETSTLDPTGEIIKSAEIPGDWENNLDIIAREMTGKIMQVPPAFSAKHVDGERSYKMARKGMDVDLEPVEVEIFSLEFLEPAEQWVDFVAHVSGGTYIRSLGRDIAIKLGTVGHIIGLERIKSGKFPVEEAIPFKAFEVGGSQVLMHHLRKVDEILESLPSIEISDASTGKIVHGQVLTSDNYAGNLPEAVECRIYGKNGRFLSLGRMDKDKGGVIPFKPWITD